MKKIIGTLPLDKFQIHPTIQKTLREKNLTAFIYTIKTIGQITPVKVIERSGQLYIIDGVSRFNSAKQVGLEVLKYEIVEIIDEKIMEYRLLSNAKINRGMIEMCLEAEHLLNLIGKSQGKKRNLMGFQDFESDDNFGEVGKDRYDLTCALLGIEMKGSTLRKLMYVFWSEYNPQGKSKSGIIEQLDASTISIDSAYKLLKDKETKKSLREKTEKAKLYIAHSSVHKKDKPFKLFCKSSLVMDEISDNSIPMAIYSPPYFQQRKYRNQDEMMYGQESSLQEYIEHFMAFNQEVFRKLNSGGVAVIIIGESYQGGYQGVSTRAEMAIEEIGFKILDVPTWVKTNQKYSPHPFRFQNSQEKIIVAHKPGKEPHFTPVYRKGSVDDFKARKTKSGGLYIASPETCITNVIETPVFNPNTLREIDPDFKHDAPCPPEIYQIFIEAYSRPGDEILDIHVGAGTVGIALSMGRKVIGYDVDPLSIEFSQKRFEWYLKQDGKTDDGTNLSVAV